MSRNRHEPYVRCLGLTVPPGHRVEPHTHAWPQLVYAVQGVISIDAGAGCWVVPPTRALWIAAGVDHSLSMRGRVEMQTLYFRPNAAPKVPDACCVIEVPPLLRELIVHVVASGGLDGTSTSGRALFRVLVDQLRVVPQRPLSLPLPKDARARRVAEGVLSNPGSSVSLGALARRSGASSRTIERSFLSQTGMTLGRWRQHARLHEAIRLLGDGGPVTTVARQVGYRSPSAFVAAFRKCFGRTPAQYFHRTP